MKKVFCLLLASILLISVIPMEAQAAGYQGKVTFVGQWTNESETKVDTEKNFNSADDKLGVPEKNSDTVKDLAKQFLGWSDKPPVENGKLSDGARLFSAEDPISKVFPNGIPDDAKIYGVYYSANEYDKPFPKSGSAIRLVGRIAENLKDQFNDNKAYIGHKLQGEEILPETKLVEDESDENRRTIIDCYSKKDDENSINEVVLNAEFEMDDTVSMIVYKNYNRKDEGLPILSRDYLDRYADGEFNTKDHEEAGYTYMDLNLNFDEDENLIVPEKLFLEYKSYSWRPLYVMDKDKNILNIFDLGGNSLGNDKHSFDTLVKNDNHGTTFGVETNGNKDLTLRVVLRDGEAEKIPESAVNPEGNQSIAEKILENMTLRCITSEELGNKEVVRITDKKAKELADSDAAEKLTVTGSIEGHIFLDAGKARAGKIMASLKSNSSAGNLKANDLELSYKNCPDSKPNPDPNPNPNCQPEPGKIYTYYEDENGKEIAPKKEGVEPKIHIENYDFVETTVDKMGNIHHHYKKILIKDPDPWLIIGIYNRKEKQEHEFHTAYIKGYEDMTVRAEGNLTRAEAAAMVVRLAELNLNDNGKANYSDLEENAWYLPYINAALKAKMLDSDLEGNLRPNEKITRAEFAKMLASIDESNEMVSNFKDIAGHKYEKEINQIYGNKRIEGYEDGTFKPDEFLTRAEAATILNRMFNRVADEIAIEGFEYSLNSFKDLDINDWYYYEIVEAANTHEFIRRDGSDKYDRVYEDWNDILNN